MCLDVDWFLVWYWNVLSIRVRKFEGCLDGNLINRKIIIKSISVKKYVYDCYIFYLFF